MGLLERAGRRRGQPAAALEVEQLDLLLHCTCGEIARIGVLSLGIHVTCPRCARTWVVRLLLGTVQEQGVAPPSTEEIPSCTRGQVT